MDINLEKADEYFSNRLYSESWFELTDEEKHSALCMAQDKIKGMPFIGTKDLETQEKPFPRCYKGRVFDMPENVAKAVFEEAFSLTLKNNADMLQNLPQGVQSLSLGSASITFNSNGNSVYSLSKTSMMYLEDWLKKGFDIEPEKFREVY